MSKLEMSHEELREKLAQSREELAQSEARHQQQITEVIMSIRDMFAQLSPLMRDSNPSQVANKCYLVKHYFLQCIVM